MAAGSVQEEAMTLEEQLKSELATRQNADVERALLVISGCNDWDKLDTYRERLGQLDTRFREYLKDSGLKDSDDRAKKAYALHRFMWRRKPKKNYALARLEDRLLNTIKILPPFSGFMIWLSGIKYKDNENMITDVIDNYLKGEVRTGNCLGLTVLYTALALRNGIDAEIILQPGHILSSIEKDGKTMPVENTKCWGFNAAITKIKRWKKNSLNTLIASEANSRRKKVPEDKDGIYRSICYFADPEYRENDYNKNSKWQMFLKKASGIFKRKKKGMLTETQITADHYYERGNWLAENYQAKKAIGDFTRAIELDNMHFGAYCERGIAEYKLGHFDEAERDLTKALEIYPLNIRAILGRGNARYMLGKHKKAIEDYTDFISLETEEAAAYQNRAVMLEKIGELEKAMQDRESAGQIAAINELKSKYQ